ncbi:DUF1642 domain-containing protein [Enterococcus faecalis]|uniref:DUF1642 domain-containing protein n=1 Tax=Enterococcus faecalis TaxID=1351 RepID=UPI00293645C8|nr:DUF1642 domain-containing protein [Enterococcus faecalis]MDV2512573.1 DUF1642 domain-containing protein [Enterococcus faecalis]
MNKQEKVIKVSREFDEWVQKAKTAYCSADLWKEWCIYQINQMGWGQWLQVPVACKDIEDSYGHHPEWTREIHGNKELHTRAILDGYEVEKEQLYWAVRGVTDYFRCDEKIIVFKKEEEALEVANLIGINTEVKKMNSIDCSECISIEELRNENEEPLFYVALPKIGDTEFCYLWTDTDGAVYTQGNKGLCIGRLKHTEQEIKSIDERYWPFAVKVDGKK